MAVTRKKFLNGVISQHLAAEGKHEIEAEEQQYNKEC